MIDICYAIQDKTSNYWKYLATSMLSVLENTNSNINFHILHDKTLSVFSKSILNKITVKYNAKIFFYDVEKEKCNSILNLINDSLSGDVRNNISLSTFYRLFIFTILPMHIERILYLDSDIIVNLDVDKLCIIECSKGIGAVTDLVIAAQIPDEAPYFLNNDNSRIEKYFNAGVLLLDRSNFWCDIREIDNSIKDFFSRYPKLFYLDQDVLNYYFSNYTELSYEYNTMVNVLRLLGEFSIESKIYHYAGNAHLTNCDDCYGVLYYNYYNMVDEYILN